MDIVIIEIKPSDKIKCSYLEIDKEDSTNINVNKYNDNPVYILGYPYGKDCTFSFGKMKVFETNNKKYISHKCSTSTGSSGSPIILLENSKCIGIHLQGSKFKNGGNFLFSSVNSFKNKYNANHQYDNNQNAQYNQNNNNLNSQYNNNMNNQYINSFSFPV